MSLGEYTVRQSKIKDSEEVWDLVCSFGDDVMAEYLGETKHEHIKMMIANLVHTSFVLCHNGSVVGVLAGMVVPNCYNGGLVYQEVIWYVNKKHRKYGLKLIRAVESWCKDQGVKMIIMGYIANHNPEQMKKLYEKCGYREMETQCIKKI